MMTTERRENNKRKKHNKNDKYASQMANNSADSESEDDDDGIFALCHSCLGRNSSTLFLFTFCQILIFFDRGLVAGCLPAIQVSLGGLTDTEAGVLGSGFIFGYMLACPMFAFLSKTVSPYKLMALGLFLWTCATGACALTGVGDFFPLLAARILTGVGEASFAGLAPTCIDDVAPLAHRTIWLSCFFAGIPLGSAGGYVAGGYFAKIGFHFGFFLEAIMMIPLVFVVFFWKEKPSTSSSSDDSSPSSSSHSRALRDSSTRRSHSSHRRIHSWARLKSQDDLARNYSMPHGTGGRRTYGTMDEREPDYEEEDIEDGSRRALLPSSGRAAVSSSSSSSSAFSRSISTPALQRLQLHDGAFAPKSHQQQRSEHLLLNTDAIVDEERPSDLSSSSATNSPSVGGGASSFGSDTGVPVSAPPSVPATTGENVTPSAQTPSPSAMRRTPGGSIRRMKEMDRKYIRPDPSNPFHAPGSSSSSANVSPSSSIYHNSVPSSAYAPSIYSHSRRPVVEALSPDAYLPSPGSFHPHYQHQQARIRAVQRGEASPDDDMFVTDILTLLTDGVYIVVVLGYAALAFVVGALSFWGPVDFSKNLHIGLSRATRMIGAITFFCGLGGTFAGGWCLDYRGASKGIFAVISALELCCVFTTLSIIFALAAVMTDDLTLSMVSLALADFFLFATGAPVNAALLSVAPKNMRSLAMAMSILLMHALGDLPSPFLMGVITDQVGSIRLALICLCLWLFWTVLFWGIGVYLARGRADAFRRQLSLDMSLPVDQRWHAPNNKRKMAHDNRQESSTLTATGSLARRGSTGALTMNSDAIDTFQTRPPMARSYQHYDADERAHEQAYSQDPYSEYHDRLSRSSSANSNRSLRDGARYTDGSRVAGGSLRRDRIQTIARDQRHIRQQHHSPYPAAPIIQGLLPIYDAEGRIVGYTQAGLSAHSPGMQVAYRPVN